MANTLFKSQYGAVLFYDQDAHARRWIDVIGNDVVKDICDFTHEAVDLTSGEYDPGFTITRIETGAGESSFGPTDGQGGWGRITTDNAENDGVNAQRRGESYKLLSSIRLYFGVRFKLSDATESDYFLGLAITDTDILGGVTDRIGFQKLDGSTSVTALAEQDSVESQVTGVMTQDAETWHILELFWDGPSGRLYFFVDNEETDRLSSFADVPTDEELRVTFQFLTGTAAATTLDIDWFRVFQIGRA